MKTRSLLLLPIALLAACASVEEMTGNNPIIDTQGVNMIAYNGDLSECQDYADQVAIGQKAVAGAVSGGVVGSVFGAVLGDSDTAQRGAGVGAVGGGARGVGEGLREWERVIRTCLRGRGYRVVN